MQNFSLPNFSLPDTLSSKRVRLQKRRHDFDEEIKKLIDANRQYLRKYLFWVDAAVGLDDAVSATNHFSALWDKQEAFTYMILDKQSSCLLGFIGVHGIDLKNHLASIGYWIEEKSKGNGYVSEALNLLEAEIFSKGIRRLEIRCDEQNISSANVAKRNGYFYEATLSEVLNTYGDFHNEMIFVKFNRK